jgi:hypothetical protein
MAETSLVVRGVALRQAQGDAKVSGAPMRRGDSPERHAELVEADAPSSRPELVEGRVRLGPPFDGLRALFCVRVCIGHAVALLRVSAKNSESGTRMARVSKFAPRKRRYSTRTIRVP